MVETDVDYPTDINLLFDAMRKVITLVAQECPCYRLSTWRQSKYHLRQVKRLYRQAPKLKRSRTKDPRQQQAQQRFAGLRACSFDQGFYSPANQFALAGILDEVVLPKKGRLSRAERAVASSASFVAARRAHAGVESAINALHGLDRGPDHGLAGFKRYVALAVVARNIHRGAYRSGEQAAAR